MLWPPDAKSQLIGKDPDAGKDWRQEETGVTEDEIVWEYHQLNGHEFQQTLGDRYATAMGSQRVEQDLVTEEQLVQIISQKLSEPSKPHSTVENYTESNSSFVGCGKH